ncbi:MAG TPA: hypothetical protein VH497_05605 [Vicinamibacterales bacterium]|jgi:hypothetical protein
MQQDLDLQDLPPIVIVERRRERDRRTFWRGGRRNTDWTNRPPGAWAQMERQQSSAWHYWFSRLPFRDTRH